MNVNLDSPFTINQLSQNIGVSHQDARKQLLVASKLVHLKSVGRETQVILDSATLLLAQKFLLQMESQRERRLQLLKQFTQDTQSKVIEEGAPAFAQGNDIFHI